jgi:predicted transcriptional regulator YheO
MKNYITLTLEERTILNSYKSTIDGLAAYLGSSYEITLHSLEDLDHSVIKIVNGFHTERKVGFPITDLALFMLEKINNDKDALDYQVYFSKNKLGEPLKSTTIAVRGNEDRIIGLICINLYLGTPLIHFVSELMPQDTSVFASENYLDSPTMTIEQELQNAKEIVFNDINILPSLRNKEIIRILYKKRVFEIKNSVEQVAIHLNITVNTVYFHLRNIAKKDEGIEK